MRRRPHRRAASRWRSQRAAGEAFTTSKGLSVDTVDAESSIAALVPEWDRLAVEIGAQPFCLPAMALAWHRHLGKGSLEVVTCRDRGGELRALMPLQRRRRGPVEILEPLGQGLGAVTSVVTRDVDEAKTTSLMWRHLADQRAALHVMHYQHTGKGLSHLRRHDSFDVRATLADVCPVIDLRGWHDAVDFLSVPERSGIRKKLRKADRALGHNQLDFGWHTAPDSVADAIDGLGSVYDAAEAERPRLHLGRGRYREFFEESLQALAAGNQLAVLVASVDDVAVAFDVYAVSGSRAYAILGRFHPAYSAYSPGHQAMRAAVEWGLRSGLDAIDLQLGTDLYKLRWSTSTYDTVRVVATPPGRSWLVRAVLASVATGHRARTAVRERLETAEMP